ncbi:MAG: nitroreductase family protein [Bacteroidetes bacterium]|nr:nitroreductase family protein [Bacteroidota bacterium]MCL5024977.1 nitroreductase family protein [Chloroflexota bacterium]
MDFNELARNRYSVRSYLPTPVPADKLQRILEAAALAPTAANRQQFRVIVIHTEGREAEMRRIYNRDWFVAAPIVLCVCGIPEATWVRRDGKNYCDVDVAIVMDHVIMAATSEGLGTCWVGAFDTEATREVLGLPPEAEPIAFTPLGYSADSPRPKKRKPIEELVSYERW